jgi:hypothetical protein
VFSNNEKKIKIAAITILELNASFKNTTPAVTPTIGTR